jgi:2-hydroxy-3-oxopropionate reductase
VTSIGFIGLGVMGRPMAANLLAAGHSLAVFNRSEGSIRALAGEGARAAEGIADAVAEAEVVITMLPDSDDVAAVVPEAIAAAPSGSLLIDMSSISPVVARELAADAGRAGIGMLDAPVSGGDVGAREGTLSIMVGGDAGDFERARPLFDVLGATVTHVGPAGAGQVVKACNQAVVAVTIEAVSEALVLGERGGVDPALVLDVLSGGLAGNKVMEVRRANFLEHRFDPGFRARLHAKDLRIALDEARSAGVALPATALVSQLFNTLVASGRGDEDHSALLTVVEQLAGAEPGGPAEPAD